MQTIFLLSTSGAPKYPVPLASASPTPKQQALTDVSRSVVGWNPAHSRTRPSRGHTASR